MTFPKYPIRGCLPRFALLLAAATVAWPQAGALAEWQFQADRVVAVSDVHGDFDAMVATLASGGLVDESRAWAGGSSTLVVTGDLLDRGPDSRRVMDLLMALEAEAGEAGGAVHVLLGNHEVMNLVGDLRYVSDAEYAAFADDEAAEERDEAWQRYREEAPEEADEAVLRGQFEERYPPGFFAHRRAFRSDGHYGAWLLDQPLLIVVNDTAFTHGGLSPLVTELGLEGVNRQLMQDVEQYMIHLETVIDAGLLDPAENFYRHAAVLESLDTSALPPEQSAAVAEVIRLNASQIHGPRSPLWYRGNAGCGELVEYDRLMAALDAIDAERVVIGHTPTLNRKVLSRFDGRVIEIDTGMLTSYYGGSGYAVVFDDDGLRVVPEQTGDSASIETHPRRVGTRAASISAGDIERLLTAGEISEPVELENGQYDVRVSLDDVSLGARFIPNPRGRNFVPDLAAYQLDRFLGLDMVPVTVAREYEGDAGVLQFRPESTMTEAARREAGLGGSAWCPLPAQWNAMYVFDSLIHNPGRAQDRMLYSQDNWQLMLTGHDVSFDTSRLRPGYLRDVQLDIGQRWQERLTALNGDVVDELLEETLDRRRRRALSARRDRLLEDAAGIP